MPKDDPAGIRNNNYLNVKNNPSDHWQDAGGRPSASDEREHAVFTDPAYGVRAGIVLLRSYYFKHKLRTIADILARWAPADDTVGSLPGLPKNSPVKYANFVAGKMGIGATDGLSLFNPDRSVGDAKQLRALFYAMAEYEVGQGFKVPDAVFDAGLALVRGQTIAEAAATSGGPTVEAAHTSSTTAAGSTAAPAGEAATAAPSAQPAVGEVEEALKWEIGGSVGNWDKGAVNAGADVEVVQEMLRLAAQHFQDPRIDPQGVDGEIAKAVEDSATVSAIIEFQSRFMRNPDGLISVGGRTWRELLAVVEGTSQLEVTPPPPPGDKPVRYFPFTKLPRESWSDGQQSFGWRRSKGKRVHAACDLYFPMGTTIHAIADGKVIEGPYYFYEKTWALEVDHGEFIARYGEVRSQTLVSKGDRVTAGQPIAQVGRLNMLHLELYSKTVNGNKATGSLSVLNEKTTLRDKKGRPYYRRRDLIDPTRFLNEWKHNLPGKHVAPQEVAAISPAAAATTAAATIPAVGFCVHIKRVRQERRSSMDYPRTVSEFQCYWNGSPVEGLKGQMVERGGPGDNTTAVGDERDLRISEGTYRLSVHEGTHYKTYGYMEQSPSYENRPNPGLLLLDTRERKYILIHPGEDYVKSIGCLNPAAGLAGADSGINFAQSRSFVISMIDAMKSRLGDRFPKSGAIPDACVVIEGEPV